MLEEMSKILLEYSEKFDDNFPVFIVSNLSEEEIIRLANEAIKNNKPYKPEIEEGAIY